jgi:membrane protein DedA with SNARE-associated domain
MSGFLTNIGLIASQNKFLAYFIVYIITIFLGNISAFAGFWMAVRGFFGSWSVPFLILTIFAADVSGDLLWYSLGSTLRDTRFGNWVKNRIRGHEKIEARLRKNGARWIFVSKFLYASSFPIIFTVGWCKVSFRKFFRTSLLSILLWVPILSAIAYGLTIGLYSLGSLAIFKQIEIFFFVGLGLFLLADYFAAKAMRKVFGGNGNGVNGGNINVESYNASVDTRDNSHNPPGR